MLELSLIKVMEDDITLSSVTVVCAKWHVYCLSKYLSTNLKHACFIVITLPRAVIYVSPSCLPICSHRKTLRFALYRIRPNKYD